MKWLGVLIVWVLAVTLCFLLRPAHATEIQTGKDYTAKLDVCVSRGDAVELANADEEGKPMDDMWILKQVHQQCIVTIVHFRPVEILKEFDSKASKLHAYVIKVQVEMDDSSWKEFYVITPLKVVVGQET